MQIRTDGPVYLDHNATTPLLPEVLDAMLPYLREHYGNPSSGHALGAHARAAVGRARAQVAALLGARLEEVLFTSGGTEANNLALYGVTRCLPSRRGVVTTALEHAATAHPCNDLEARGWHVTRLEPGPGGAVDAEEGARVLDTDTALVSVMHANNETGVLQPVRALADAAHAVGAWVHTDAAQSVGKVEVNVDTLGVDLLSLAGHKIYAPKGVGALYVRTGTPLEPLMRGAGHERGLRPGTENVASIVGLGVACALVAQDLSETAARLAALRDRLFAGLAATVPGLVVHGDPALRLSNTLSVRFPGVSGNALLEVTPEVAASTGSACHADDESASSVLLAMGVPPREALGTVRLSLGRCTTEAEVERAVTALVRGWRLLTGAL